MMVTYTLHSNAMIHAPGIVAWAINGYAFERDQAVMMEVITTTWPMPEAATRGLLDGTYPHTVDGDTVSFEAD